MAKRRVVVTGLGVLSPVGNDYTSTWQNIVEGKSGIGPITVFDASEYTTHFAGEVKDFNVEDYIAKKETKKMDKFIQFGIAAGKQALADSGLVITEKNASRVGVAIGSGIGGLSLIEENHTKLVNSGPKRISPFFVPATITNMISGFLSIMEGLKGPNLNIVTACTTGVHNMGIAARTIAYGDADAMLAGGAEASICPLGLGGFAAARALSTRNDNPQIASRPWDKDRDGFVMGEGAGVVMLEEYESAKARGAKIYAELVGFGMSGDAHHMTSPPENGEGAAAAMHNALNDASVNAQQVGYINAHGTSTPAGDVAEVAAVKTIFEESAKKVLVSSTKSMTGHLLGAAGAVEAIFTILALKDQIAPPTINLDNPGEGCDLDFVANEARSIKMDYALCNSFGFGGTNGSLLFKKV
ncbi:beta-ketoacyl-ACP synthase II [Paraglaciecola chathamensis]|uniref:3-oxoacyl-[acyl-carrier-protein] synthase 2 n=3 Tax=Paraglaciecola chathamensis TaxID=368405 RepID=A0A8H9IG09_9ALTE|nr:MULTISPECIES: beta-ketoacyl-ACP synthase II [Paraglaciecola]AEE23092.1 3-oxoacyl-(acyl-carrier-protein) synthase 2 [Glaciecola sp. 4H-3-7+YE-5]MBN24079.1 beta-ketoacyl-[acyl-carrier-protein] synthase II [Alteromonadaceae bacterium]GAC05231.1 3-oxoacyl-[acyl-carrier-protein] synthase II [Paraglaciecola agarilytica NO2]GAC09862.1 3-oxoacyl-[acyl-carrier-protein] synthase II [Paraglaciecola chathamensis S18K6]GGZ62501.1 3-oxoacyl-[acyl-carrier-protein] synthase 2 [Paraglaciecola oceanifecundan